MVGGLIDKPNSNLSVYYASGNLASLLKEPTLFRERHTDRKHPDFLQLDSEFAKQAGFVAN